MGKQRVMIVDDSAMNRDILSEMIEDEYEIVEFENGKQAISYLQGHPMDASVMLLDIVMPEMDGFEVLSYMNQYHWIDELPVVMISAENDPELIERAYALGVSDFINRPFNISIVRQRVKNTILLYTKQRKLANLVVEQMSEKERSTSMLVSMLSQIVEFRNGESGVHVMHISTITTMLLQKLVEDGCADLTPEQVELISLASSLHDIGKIAIPDEVLNKPGRFTREEFEIMKQHSVIGADMLKKLQIQEDVPLVQYAYEICRWHHERYDGKGYPDRLKGDEIPLSAQVVSLADVYDALTSPRCYKKAFSHETAMSMIRGGQCGSFNPTLLACFESIADQVRDVLQGRQPPPAAPGHLSAKDVSQKLSAQADLSFSTTHVLRQLEFEKARCRFLVESPGELAFTYYDEPPFLELSPSLADLLEVPVSILEPLRNEDFLPKVGDELFRRAIDKLKQTTYHEPDCQLDCQLPFLQSDHQCRLVMRSIWDGPENAKRVGFIGRVVDYTELYTRMDRSRNAAAEYALGKLIPRGFQWFSATSESLPNLIRALRFIFDAIRLVNVEEHQEFIPDEQGRISLTDRPCYTLWSRGQQCEKCISHNVVSQKTRVSKFEFVGDDVYHVVSAYIEVDGQPRALEMVTRVNFDSLDTPAPSTDKEVLEAISIHGNRLYLDPLTGAYNRWYYEETLRGLSVTAVAMLDVDHFKSINDEFSHQAGDLALAAVAKVLLSCVRSVDSVVRYGGDEFALVFQGIPQDIFHLRLEQIRSEVECIRLEEFPDIRLSASIGGVYGSGTTQEMLNAADLLMYRAKQKRNSVCLGETGSEQETAQ